MRINQNIAAQNAYRNLSVTNTQMGKSLEKLSSGFRINRAADDAAGLAISEGLRSQVGGLKVAVRNAQDGISVVQTAEGALTEVHALLQRTRDLAVQAASTGGNSAEARDAAATEVEQAMAEIGRISQATQFGGKTLLDGSESSFRFHVGSGSGAANQVDVVIGAMDVAGLGLDAASGDDVATTVTGSVAANARLNYVNSGGSATENTTASNTTARFDFSGAAESFTVNGETVNINQDYSAEANEADAKAAMLDDINAQLTGGAADVTASFDGNNLVFTNGTNGDTDITLVDTTGFLGGTGTQVDGTASDGGAAASFTVAVDGGSATTVNLNQDYANAGAKLTAINTALGSTGVVASYGGGGELVFTHAAGGEVEVGGTNAAAEFGTATTVQGHDGSIAGLVRAGSTDAIDRIDEAISSVSTQRANLGAYQNRLEHTIANLSVTQENLSASESRIRDTDMAQEMVSFTRAQILTQAGTSMLAQANQAPQGVLSLLR